MADLDGRGLPDDEAALLAQERELERQELARIEAERRARLAKLAASDLDADDGLPDQRTFLADSEDFLRSVNARVERLRVAQQELQDDAAAGLARAITASSAHIETALRDAREKSEREVAQLEHAREAEAQTRMDHAAAVRAEVQAAPLSAASLEDSAARARQAGAASPQPAAELAPAAAAPAPDRPLTEAEIIERIKAALSYNDMDFRDFQTSSGQFARGVISADTYCDKYVSLLGMEAAEELFPSLLVLLPREDKREELQRSFARARQQDRARERGLGALLALATGGTTALPAGEPASASPPPSPSPSPAPSPSPRVDAGPALRSEHAGPASRAARDEALSAAPVAPAAGWSEEALSGFGSDPFSTAAPSPMPGLAGLPSAASAAIAAVAATAVATSPAMAGATAATAATVTDASRARKSVIRAGGDALPPSPPSPAAAVVAAASRSPAAGAGFASAPPAVAAAAATPSSAPLYEGGVLSVRVVSFEEVASVASYTAYVLRCRWCQAGETDDATASTEWELRRRYSEFSDLKRQLTEAFPSIKLPPFPSKLSLAGRLSLTVERRAALDQFMQGATVDPRLLHTPVLQSFLALNSQIAAAKRAVIERLQTKRQAARAAEELPSILPCPEVAAERTRPAGDMADPLSYLLG